jgi:hypothetical protein
LSLGSVSIHGGRGNDQRVMVDGVTIRNVAGTGSISNFVPDMGSAQEVTVDYAALSAEAITGGVTFNYVPREGGNRFTGSFFGTGANSSFQGSNYTPELAAQGLTAPNRLKRVYDVNTSVGGPIFVDKLWFYSSARWHENSSYVAGMWENLNAGDPTKWLYEPDLSRQGVFYIDQSSINTRLTWQANAKNKINLSWDHQNRSNHNVNEVTSPESTQNWSFPRLHTGVVAWTSPINSRLLLEARGSTRAEGIRNFRPPEGDVFRYLIRVQEQGGLIPNLIYRGAGVPNNTATGNFHDVETTLWEAKASLSYVTGAHAFKVGFGNIWGYQLSNSFDVPTSTSYRLNNGIPNQIQERQMEWDGIKGEIRSELGFYAQDRWTIKRLTLNLGARFDYFHNGFPPFHLGPTWLLPNRDITFADTSWYKYKDLSPRLGGTYDLFGDGKTAVKASLGRYMSALLPLDGWPVGTQLVNRVTRSWVDANRDFVPDCVLQNPLQNGECGTISDLRFGQAIPSANFDPASLQGWGARPYNWEFSAGVERQLIPRLGVEAVYFRRWYGNFSVTDNRAVGANDFSPFSVTAPSDPRLPGGGGYVVGGLFDLNPNKVGQVDNYTTFADNFGGRSERWHGVDITTRARVREGLLLQGGVSTGQTTLDSCNLRAALIETAQLNPFCRVEGAFRTHVSFLGTYTVPVVDVRVAGTLQNVPGPEILANVVYSNAQVQPSLGRPLSGGAANVTVNVVDPGTLYGERLTELDLRFSKLFRFGVTRTTVNLDVYNALNGNVARSLNNNYATWLRPTAILDARLFKISAQVDF